MEEFLGCLAQAQNSNQETQTQIFHYISEKMQTPDFGPLLFEALSLSTLSDQFLIICCGFLKEWAMQNWNKFSIQEKTFFFQQLKTFILKDHRSSIDISNIFVTVAFRESDDAFIFEPIIFEFFKYVQNTNSICTLYSMMNIIKFLAKRYRFKKDVETLEVSLLFRKIVDITFPFFNDSALLTTNEGCSVIKMALSSFTNIFFRYKPSFDIAITPLSFVQNVLVSYMNQQIPISDICFLGYCCNFFKKFIQKKECLILLSGQIPIIFQTLLRLLSIIITHFPEDSYVISSILATFLLIEKHVNVDLNIFQLILSASKLTQTDLANFSENPLLYYIEIYSKEFYCNSYPRLQSRSLISKFIERSRDFALYMLTLPPEEHILRCISFSIRSYVEYELIPQLLEYVERSLPLNSTPDLVVVKLDILRSCVEYYDNEKRISILTFAQNFLVTNSIVITLFATRLIKRLLHYNVIPNVNIIPILITLLNECPTEHVSKTLSLMLKIYPNIVIPEINIVLDNLIMKVINDIKYLSCDDDLDTSQQKQNAIEQNLQLISQIIDNAPTLIVNNHLLLELIQYFYNQDDIEILQCIIPLSISFIKSGNFQLINEFFKIYLKALQKNKNLFSENFDKISRPIFVFVSLFPIDFLKFGISNIIFQYAIELFIDPKYSDNLFNVSDLILWLLLIDKNLNLDLILNVSFTILNLEESELPLKLCTLQFIAAIYLNDLLQIDFNLIQMMINLNNYFFRMSQKHLFAFLFLKLAINVPQSADMFVALALKLISEEKILSQMNFVQRQKRFDEMGYPVELSALSFEMEWKSPIEQKNYDEILQNALKCCSNEAIMKFKEEYKILFN